jgi:hypothetical protein
MIKALVCRALPLAMLALSTSSALVFAEDPAEASDPAVLVAADTTVATPAADGPPTSPVPASPTTESPSASAAPDVAAGNSTPASAVLSTAAIADDAVALSTDTEHWTAYGFNVMAPSSMWPMLELLHKQKFDWELYSAQQRPTPLVWAALAPGVYGQYVPSQNVVKLSFVLQSSSVEVATAFLAHELTHLNDDLNGKLGDMRGDVCYQAETRAFVNEANFWQMVVGPYGKTTQDPIEAQENAKMHAFVGNSQFADLVLRTTASYIKQCSS